MQQDRQPRGDKPFRFYDNRQKYLMFVTTCGEKWAAVERIDQDLARLDPRPPALRLFDAGVGDGTVLAGVLRRLHQRFPNAPFVITGKEISLEDVRLAMDKTPDRLVEHPETVFVFTNLLYAEAPYLQPRAEADRAKTVYRDIRLTGNSAWEFERQIKQLHDDLAGLWQVAPSPRTGNPRYVTPSVVAISRADHAFTLDALVPRGGQPDMRYDLALAVQPYRARQSLENKIRYVLDPLARALAPGGQLVAIQSAGRDPGLEIVREIWPDEDPFATPGPVVAEALLKSLAGGAARFEDATGPGGTEFRYRMHTMASELDEHIGTSTLFAAWNAATYVAQIEDARLAEAMTRADHIAATRRVLERHGGLWFTDEAFTIRRTA